jgi:hypothetical protein
MNEKIKWFGRYLGCEYKKGLTGLLLTQSSLYDAIHSDSRLILKELKDITEYDLRECSKLGKLWMQWDLFYIYLRRLIFEDVNNFNWKVTIEIVDFLRSKGYAIGIPKEYYITKEELKEAK